MGKRKMPGMICGLVCLFSFTALPLEGSQWLSEKFGCVMNFPEGQSWISTPMPPTLRGKALQTIDAGKTISLLVKRVGGYSLNGKYVTDFEKEFYSRTGAKKTNGSWKQIEGRYAYQSDGILEEMYFNVQTTVIIVLDRGYLYQIMALKRGDNPLKDEELLRSIKSFQFLPPPVTQAEMLGVVSVKVLRVLLLGIVIMSVNILIRELKALYIC